MKKITVISALLLFFSASCGSDRKEYKFPHGNFRLSLPLGAETPKHSTQSLKLPWGQMDLHLMTASHLYVAYLASFSDYPENKAKEGTEALLKEATEFLKRSLVESHANQLFERPGLSTASLEGKQAGKYTYAAFAIRGKRLYQLAVVLPEKKDSVAADYFKSFEILGP